MLCSTLSSFGGIFSGLAVHRSYIRAEALPERSSVLRSPAPGSGSAEALRRCQAAGGGRVGRRFPLEHGRPRWPPHRPPQAGFASGGAAQRLCLTRREAPTHSPGARSGEATGSPSSPADRTSRDRRALPRGQPERGPGGGGWGASPWQPVAGGPCACAGRARSSPCAHAPALPAGLLTGAPRMRAATRSEGDGWRLAHALRLGIGAPRRSGGA